MVGTMTAVSACVAVDVIGQLGWRLSRSKAIRPHPFVIEGEQRLRIRSNTTGRELMEKVK